MQVSPAIADVVIFNVGERGAEARAVEAAAQCSEILVVTVNPDVMEGMHIMLARLFFARFAPETYQKFMYIDADTQICQSLDPLFQYDLAPDRFLASRDPMVLLNDPCTNIGRQHRMHWADIGMLETDYANYLNSGVIVANRESWDSIGRIAIELFKKTPDRYKFRDQDVINLVGRDQVDIMSFRWNFPGLLMGRGYEEIIQPHVYHFMSDPRPWQGPFPPWGLSWHNPYLKLEKKHPELARFRLKLSRHRYLKYVVRQRYMGIMKGAWNHKQVCKMIKELEKTTAV